MIYLQILIPAYLVFFFFLLFFFFFRHRNKILVRIKTPLEEYHKYGKPTTDRKHVILKLGKLTTKIKINSVLRVKKLIGHKRAIDVFADAEESIKYDYDVPKTEQPHWDKEQSRKFVTAKVLETYSRGEEQRNKNFLFIIIIMQIAMLAIILFALRGLIFG